MYRKQHKCILFEFDQHSKILFSISKEYFTLVIISTDNFSTEYSFREITNARIRWNAHTTK